MFTETVRSDERGSTLIEAIIAIAVLGIAVGASTTYFAQSGTKVRVEGAKEAQMMIATRVQSALSNREAILKTMKLQTSTAAITRMKVCSDGSGGATGCNTATKASAAMEFDLLDAETAADGSGVKLSGNTVGWDIEGNPCLKGTPNCLFGVRTKFWATCDPATIDDPNSITPRANCTQARYLNFKYLVTVDQARAAQRNWKIAPYPSEDAYNNDQPMGAVRVSTTSLNLTLGGDCGNPAIGLRSVGFDRDGKPICRCIDGRPAPAGGKPCADKQCPTGYLMVGFKETYNPATKETYLDPDCLSAAQCENDTTFNAKCPCKVIDLSPSVWTPDAGDCGTGFWMVHVNYGKCTATTDKDGKGAPETVKCTEHTAKCCKMDAK